MTPPPYLSLFSLETKALNLEPDQILIRLRPHLPRYEDSMARMCFIADETDVIAYIQCCLRRPNPRIHELTQRLFGFDQRNGWDSWLISLRTIPILWTDKPVADITTLPPVVDITRCSQVRPSSPPTGRLSTPVGSKGNSLITGSAGGNARTAHGPASK